jgi:uncharacterized protein YijF (DUF1287 family)
MMNLNLVVFSFFCFTLFSVASLFCNRDESEIRNAGIGSEIKDSIDEHPSFVLSESQSKVLNGAKKNLAEGTEYDLTMGYYVLTFKDGINTGSRVYPGGDLDPEIGVCSDVVVRALRIAGVVDLQEAIHDDIRVNGKDYPLSRWGNKKPDTNIDHRRVMNLEVWLSKYWEVISGNDFLPGDIVVWDMNEDGASDHIGIVSDKKVSGRYFVIHNHPDPGHVAEEDKLFKWKLAGHYRIQSK